MKQRWWIVGLTVVALVGVATAIGMRLSGMTEPFSFLDGHKPVLSSHEPVGGADHFMGMYTFKADFKRLKDAADGELRANGWNRESFGSSAASWTWREPSSTPPPPRYSLYGLAPNQITIIDDTYASGKAGEALASREGWVTVWLDMDKGAGRSLWARFLQAFGL